MEYTLEDAYETLKEIKVEREKEIDELADAISNNEISALNRSLTSTELKSKHEKFYESFMTHVEKKVPENYPIPRTSDLRVEVLAELEQEIRNMRNLCAESKARLAEIEADIVYLQNKKNDLKKMKEAYFNSFDIISNKTCEKELAMAKCMFKEVKNDLYYTVDTIFPENDGFKELLAALTQAFLKGGDDVYVNATPDVVDYVNFLLEADLVAHHRNDKNKIKLTDIL